MTHQAPGTGRLEKWDKAWVLNEASLKEFQGRPEVRVEARSVGQDGVKEGVWGGGHKTESLTSALMSCVKL